MTAIPTTALSLYLLHCLKLAQHTQKLCLIAENNHQAQWLYELLSQHRDDVFFFPDWEILPYDTLSPAPEIAAERAKTLLILKQQPNWVVITSAHAVAYRLPPQSFYEQNCLQLHVGQQLSMTDYTYRMSESGYTRVDEVQAVMEFSIRGSIVDIYPPFSPNPLRLEWDFDRIEYIRFFDPQTQLSIQSVPTVSFLPSHEFPIDKSALQQCAQHLATLFGAKNTSYQALRQGKIPAGFLFFSPLWAGEHKYSLLDYLPAGTVVDTHPGCQAALQELEERAHQAYEETSWRYGFKAFPPSDLLVDLSVLNQKKDDIKNKQWQLWPLQDTGPWQQLKNHLSNHKKWLFTFESYSRAQILSPKVQSLLHASLKECKTFQEAVDSDAPYVFCLAPLQEAVIDSARDFVVVPEAWLYQETVRVRSRATGSSVARRVRPSLELTPGSLVIHRDHGLARYKGLTTLSFDQFSQEMIELEFDKGQKLYVPLHDIARLTPYYALEQQQVELSIIGSSKWKKQVQHAQKAIEDQAAALLDIHAVRARSQGDSWSIDPTYYEFAAAFPFEETADQQSAIADVLKDLQSVTPMDRLICGDVGFGKTEVALRGIFAALSAGYQVAFLAPTTLLSQQHYETLLERFAQWPYKIALMTRHTQQSKDVLKQLEQGQIDCVVGTHKLLQPEVRFARLGLVIVDEEHRFGVRHKEALKKWRGSVNILSMTATPIPRTLSMSFQGLRDLSLIATPPAQRRSIQTMICSYHVKVIEQAIQRELFRSGQVYYLCNDIEKHGAKVEMLKQLFPQARVDSLHGQLSEKEMERRMNQFYHGRLDILVGTTIIETGIDVPGANTMIIENAHCFGLAQLHQIRGRVGRSHHQAYTYLLIPMPIEHLSDIARSRLELLVQYQDLGSGFQLATHDLEIRGAGEILGDKQSGHILDLGIDLYRQMLEEACLLLDKKTTAQSDKKRDYLIERPFAIDATQIPDPSIRLKMYHLFEKIATLEEWYKEYFSFEDRFGKMMPITKDWAQSHKWRVLSQQWQWPVFKWKKRSPLLIEFAPVNTSGSCDEKAIEQFVQDHARFISITGPRAIALKVPQEHEAQIVRIIGALFDRLERGLASKSSLLWDLPVTGQ